MVIDPSQIGLDVVKIVGNEARCFCPFHDDRKPSASFNMVEGVFNCFVCGGMSAEKLAKELNGSVVQVETIDAKAKIIREGDDFDYSYFTSLRKVNKSGITTEWKAQVSRARMYMYERGISTTLSSHLDTRCTYEGIVFLIKEITGQIIGAQMRQYPPHEPKYLFYGKRTAIWPLWELPFVAGRNRIYLTEGVFGALRARQAGVPGFATMGASSLAGAARILEGRNVVGVFDPDYAGAMAMAKLISVGIPIAFPMFEADEASSDEWIAFANHGQTIGTIKDFLPKLPDSWREPIIQHARRFQAQFREGKI